MKTLDRIILIFIIISVLILVIGYVSGSKIILLRNEGALNHWEDFSAPMKAERIVDATSNLVWVKTVDGSIYQGNPYCQQNSDCLQQWQEVDSVPSDLPRTGEVQIKRSNDCNFGEFPAMEKVPNESIECVRVQFRGPESGDIIYYAIFKDGTIKTWKQGGSMIEDFYIRFISIFLSIVVCVILLFVIDLISRKKVVLIDQE